MHEHDADHELLLAVEACSCGTPIVIDLRRGLFDRLDRIERALTTQGVTMSQIDDRVAQLQSEVGDAASSITAATDDVTRALTDLKNSLGGQLTAEQSAHFDALDQGVAGLKSAADAIKQAVDAADPATAEGGSGGNAPTDSSTPPADGTADSPTPTA